jgi:hypothetical protein
MRRTYGKEEKLDLRDYCGIKDPTPFEAVRNLIRQDRAIHRPPALARANAVMSEKKAV